MDLLRLAQSEPVPFMPPAPISPPHLSPATRTEAERGHLPEDAPLDMPAQSLKTGKLSPHTPSTAPADIGRRRAIVFGVTALVSVAGIALVSEALGWRGWQPLEVVFLGLFGFLFTLMSFGFVTYVIGLWAMHHAPDDLGLTPDAPVPLLRQRTAILMPVCNEDAASVASRLSAIRQSLIATRQSRQFDIFILSDTQNPENAAHERAAFQPLLRSHEPLHVYYRRRTLNTDRKAGNIADWVRQFGAAYAHMVVLDADSVMSGDTLVRLAGAMERHPDAGLIQTAPRLINQTSLFARAEQFAARLYGPAAACGTAWWSGSEGNFWGHNAIIRVRAFAGAAGLPHLKGPAPFGGHILSHDFVEAALLRRAGWGVHMAAHLGGSYEESPPTLIDALQRDRRWCQGNIQHAAVLGGSGLHWVNRFHLLRGVLNYLIAPVWLAMVGVGAALSATDATFNATGGLAALLAATLGFLLLPKLLATLVMLMRPEQRAGFGGRTRTTLSLLAETLLSTLLTPIVMLSHTGMVISVLTGRKSGWKSQRRSGHTLAPDELARVFWPHTLTGALLALIVVLTVPDTAPYLAVVILSLIFAAPLVALSANDTPRDLDWLFRIPEEPRAARTLRPTWSLTALAAQAQSLQDQTIKALAAHAMAMPVLVLAPIAHILPFGERIGPANTGVKKKREAS